MNRQKERSFRASIARVVAGHDFDVVAKTSASVVPAVVEVPTVETIAVPMNTVREAAMQIMTKRDGYTPEEAAQIYEVYAWGQTRGGAQEAQGIVNKVIAPMPKNPNAKDIAVEQHMPGVIKVDGGQNHAVVVMNQAMEKTMEMANTQGIAMAGINNVSTSTGANGYFAKEMAKHGYIGIVFSGPAK